jgi:hypothetical protein
VADVAARTGEPVEDERWGERGLPGPEQFVGVDIEPRLLLVVEVELDPAPSERRKAALPAGEPEGVERPGPFTSKMTFSPRASTYRAE